MIFRNIKIPSPWLLFLYGTNRRDIFNMKKYGGGINYDMWALNITVTRHWLSKQEDMNKTNHPISSNSHFLCYY